VKKILDVHRSIFLAIRVPAFAGMIGFEPYPEIRIGKELARMVRFYDLEGVFHSDELPRYGITEGEVAAVRQRLQMDEKDAFVLVGGPRDRVEIASRAIVQRLKAAVVGVTAETRMATAEGKTEFLRPRAGAARMYPETDIPPIPISESMLEALAGKVPKPWDVIVDSLSKKYGLNKTLASQIFDSDYLSVFEEIVKKTKLQPTFVSSKLTEDITHLQRQGLNVSALKDGMIVDIFGRLDSGDIPKESVILIFEKLMKREASTVDEAIKAASASSMDDEELGAALDKVIAENMPTVVEKGMDALSTLMGRAMAILRGKAGGQKINAMLKDKLQELVK
jgi:glutamyl-tRNA(Gln) amidotransferase subunit E